MKDHPVIHFEIGCHGSEKARVFFTQLFGWEISDRDAGMMINTGGDGAISGHITDLAAGEWGTYVTFYVQIEDLEIYLKKANELGGKTLVPRNAARSRQLCLAGSSGRQHYRNLEAGVNVN